MTEGAKQNAEAFEVCRSYTFARKYPKLIGRIRSGIGNDRGWTIPGGPYSPLQIGTFVVALIILIWTRSLWAHFGPINLAVYLGVPVSLAFVVRHLQIENRPPYRFLIGFLKYVAGRNHGTRNGRRVQEPRPHVVRMRTLVRVTHPEIYAAVSAQRRHVSDSAWARNEVRA